MLIPLAKQYPKNPKPALPAWDTTLGSAGLPKGALPAQHPTSAMMVPTKLPPSVPPLSTKVLAKHEQAPASMLPGKGSLPVPTAAPQPPKPSAAPRKQLAQTPAEMRQIMHDMVSSTFATAASATTDTSDAASQPAAESTSAAASQPAAASDPVTPPEALPVIPPLAPRDNLPDGYGWTDWNSPEALQEEAKLADEHKIPWKLRGPVPAHLGGPILWREIPWNLKQNAWVYEDRRTLPAKYAFDDWWSEDALAEEARLAKEFMIPWSLRGPPDGPVLGKPSLWRGLSWRPNAKKWMARGGTTLDDRNLAYGKNKGKGKGASPGWGAIKPTPTPGKHTKNPGVGFGKPHPRSFLVVFLVLGLV